MKRRVRVWDGPVRIFHWLLVLLLVAAYLSHEFDAMVWHERVGLAILGLVVFRLAWGLVGSRHARFSNFVRGPSAAFAYLHGEWRGIGPNPLGGWSVLLLLLVPLGMAATGLFANDDVVFKGPLADWISKEASDRLTSVHHFGFNLLLVLVGLHLAAIVYYRLARRENLGKPMITGYKEVEPALEETPPPASRFFGRLPALVLALAVAGLVVWGVLQAVPPAPPPVPVEDLPDW